MALKMQDKLKQKLNKGDVVVKSKKEESDIEKAMKRMEDRGLLHSILTKVIINLISPTKCFVFQLQLK